jgi:hypothetical protein
VPVAMLDSLRSSCRPYDRAHWRLMPRREATEQEFAEAAVTEYIPMPDWAPFPFVPHLTDSAANR